jgi:ubiquinone/menaquinone biosynthesis C-methylase UbiE
VTSDARTSETRVHHPMFARLSARMSHKMEQAGYAEVRDDLLAGLRGRVIEVGAGNGMNFAHYPAGVTHVLAVEPEPHLRRLAEENARHAAVPVEVVDGTADHLPVDDETIDAAIASLVLCTVPDQGTALDEIRRVLRPGGQLRFFEHVRTRSPGLARVQRVLDATIWPTLVGGCHPSRDTRAAIEAAGFHIVRIEDLRVPETRIPTPASPHILGVATPPAEPQRTDRQG